ncbi:MAG: hypothetical protein JNN08_06170 [Bryobacterales bacterium]|nr:hypothetical protein [Bryobacterales bacterium]
MRPAAFWWSCLALAAASLPGGFLWGSEALPRQAPKYTPSSLVNAASFQPGPVAPNSIVSLYGEGLAYVTRSLQPSDIRNDRMPDVLPTTGVRVLIAGVSAQIYYVSPRQVNLLVPPTLVAGSAELQLVLNGLAGPAISIRVADASPALFQQNEDTVIATRVDGTLLTRQKPGRPGDVLILYATGLGQVFPLPTYGEIVRKAAPLVDQRRFRLFLNGTPVGQDDILYVGLSPGYPGLYQINLRTPLATQEWPVIRLAFDETFSLDGLALPLTP